MVETSEFPAEMLRALLTIERTLWKNDARVYDESYLPDAILTPQLT